MSKTYDRECLTLAQSFISDSEIQVEKMDKCAEELAKEIQQTIEDFIEEKTNPEKPI